MGIIIIMIVLQIIALIFILLGINTQREYYDELLYQINFINRRLTVIESDIFMIGDKKINKLWK